MPKGKADLIVGLGYGDEGKGKITQTVGAFRQIGIRSQGGANAGHTIYLDFDEFNLERREDERNQEGREINTHTIPSTIVYEHTRNLIGPDVWLDPTRVNGEIEGLRSQGFDITPKRLGISNLASLVLPHHILEDRAKEEGNQSLGSTKAGVAFVARDEALHTDIRANVILQDNAVDLLFRAAFDGLIGVGASDEEANEKAKKFVADTLALKPYIADTVNELHELLEQGHNAVIEGAQGAGLDRRFGKHPHVTSSATTTLGLLRGAGLSHKDAGTTFGVIKMFPSKVGGGEFPDRITDPAILKVLEGEEGAVDAERGKTTGRKREIGWLSMPLLRHYVELNGVDELVLTKFDKISKLAGLATKYCVVIKYQKVKADGSTVEVDQIPYALEDMAGYAPIVQEFDPWEEDISGVRSFEDLPSQARVLLNFLEVRLGVSIGMVGVGPRSDQIIVRSDLLGKLKQSANF